MDSVAAKAKAGYRLQRIEVLNWGTFHRQIWTLPSDGHNALLTGDIGSGKSTLVDGLTTLLVPPQKIVYNKAAGAETRERSLRSYVRGYFKSEKDGENLTAKAVALRDAGSYSVLLAHFHNAGYRQTVTLAQVFWSRDHQNPPERFYVVAQKPLSIAETFTQFDADVMVLRKRLRKERGVRLFDSFAQYATAFRRRLGLGNVQALDLFYQTVSMKSVGNLTDFVRRHMLDEPPVAERIKKIRRQFDDLNRAHEAVLKARQQVQTLEPIAAESERYRRLDAQVAAQKRAREGMHAFFAAQKITLLDRRLKLRKTAHEQLSAQIEARRLQLDKLRARQRSLERAIGDSGGRRIEELSSEIERLTGERRRISAKADTYRTHSSELQLPFPADERTFNENRRRAEAQQKEIAGRRDEIANEQVEQKVRLKETGAEMSALEAELDSLRSRKTNIPRKNLAIRNALCRAIGVAEKDLPFAGEMLRVKGSETDWEGAIERLLHAFGLSLLVPEKHYGAAAAHVDATHLAGRLVYFKTSWRSGRPLEPAPEEALCRKLEIKPDTPFYEWLERELLRRFNHTCCRSTDEFRRRSTAVTPAGQIKTGGVRHEKDDRHHIDDRARYILGWQNRDKIRLLEAQLQRLQTTWDAGVAAMQQLEKQRRNVDGVHDCLQRLLALEQFAEIDWQPLARQIEQRGKEKVQIEQSSDKLRTLQAQLEETQAQIEREDDKLGRMREKRGKLREGLERDRRQRQAAAKTYAEVPDAERRALFPELVGLQPQSLGSTRITVENCDANQGRMRDWLQKRIDRDVDKRQRVAAQITRRMQDYKSRYPVETQEVDAAIESMDAFGQMLEILRREDLPRHETRFKTMLNEGTIQSIALFQAKLDSELQDIRDKIEIINRSLSLIDYDDGTYIMLVADPSRDVEIRQFREDLRACLGDTLSGSEDEAYTEHKFLQVKAIIERFNGREGQTELDKRWTRKVTDVRNWLMFSVSERWREDDQEREFYSDTAGKSGGQKEKLAYTILAAALAYQFELQWGETRSRSLRFVMIDEAFGRGSDESTRYALELFDKLNLQLLIVTPLQKINIIEDYVQSVHYIHNPDGKNSMVRNLTIEQYREERAAFQESAA